MNIIFKNQKGFTLVEAMLAIAIIAIVSLALVNVHSFMSVQSVKIKDRAFATQKAIQMIEELRALVEGAEVQSASTVNVLDNYDDGGTYNPVLTTNVQVNDPANPLSANKNVAGNWKYLRHVGIMTTDSDPYIRNVTVTVYRNNYDVSGSTIPTEALATVSAVMRTIVSNLVPTQVLDVYVIDIENVPGYWTSLSSMAPIFDSVLHNIEFLNPGLTLRTTWITRMGYGRDQEYYPFINGAGTAANTINNLAIPYIYFYPDKILTGSTYFDYYTSDKINGKINIDGTLTNTGSYPLADSFNHCVRFPDEANLYNTALQTNPNLAPSLRYLLEDMSSNPSKYMNAIFVNLHGEVLPLPPIRNYSDAAKDPLNYPNVRLVSHPENLKYAAGSAVNLRVYPYQTQGNAQYFNNTTCAATGLANTRTDTAVSFDWGTFTKPDPNITNSKNFSVSWTGFIVPRFAEQYTFTATIGNTSDGVCVWVNNTMIINHPLGGGALLVFPYTPPAAFTAGQVVPVKIQYYHINNNLDESINVQWKTATTANLPLENLPLSIIPISSVYIPSSNVVPTVSFISGDNIGPAPGNNVGNNYALTANIAASAVAPVDTWTRAWTLNNPAPASGTLITLYNTPTVHPPSGNGSGFPRDQLLYGMEYIPCPINGTPPNFNQNLTMSANGDNPKNTARWIITFPAGSLPSGTTTAFETRIGADTTTGTLANSPPNLSRTYTWIGCTPPITEQYQFMGDPRHCPYADVKVSNNYNWYFAQVPTTANGYAGFGQTTTANSTGLINGDGWYEFNTSGYLPAVDVDLPRFYWLYRNALLNTCSIWTTMCGWSYYYFGMGGEMGMDFDPCSSKLPFKNNQPWSNTTTGLTSPYPVNQFFGGARDLIASADKTWFSMNWLGELYQDKDYPTWHSTGNLPIVTGGSVQYWRAQHNADFGANFGFDRSATAGQNACGSFYNGGDSSTHIFDTDGPNAQDGYSTLISSDVQSVFSWSFENPQPSNRPFTISATASPGTGGSKNEPPEWTDATYSNIRTNLSIPTAGSLSVPGGFTNGSRVYYTTSYSGGYPWAASAMVEMTLATSTSACCFISANGLDRQSSVGTYETGGFIVCNMIRCFLDGGLYSAPAHIPQLPYINITSPKTTSVFVNGTSSIQVGWTNQWLRWDGKPYTSDYPSSTYTGETTPLVYNLKYTDGNNWYFCDDGSTAIEGKYDSTHACPSNPWPWTLPGGIQPGLDYILVVEAYRRDYTLHYSYDSVQFRINK